MEEQSQPNSCILTSSELELLGQLNPASAMEFATFRMAA